MDKRTKTVVRAGAVILVALAAGHLVQSMKSEQQAAAGAKPVGIEQVSAGAEAAGTVAEQAAPAQESATLLETDAEPAVTAEAKPAETMDETVAELPTMTVATPDAADAGAMSADPILAALPETPAETPEVMAPMAEGPTEAAPVSPEAPAMAAACKPEMQLKQGEMAMISVSISAACMAGQRVVLRHAGLAMAEELSADGNLQLDIPAMQEDGSVSALFANAEVLHDSISVPDAAKTRRFAVQWMADDAFQLHAFENGAEFGQPGDVSNDSPVSPNGGYLIALGNPSLDLPMMAEVYTYAPDAKVRISIESAVTDITCGRELLGEVIETHDGKVSTNDLRLAMPECDAIGDILVLNNPGQDVTLAAVN